MNQSKNEFLIRYGIVHKKNEDLDPDFGNYECCKERPLCKSLKEWGKMYTRVEIEKMSAKLGYSVWDNIGGPDVKCQCKWKSFVVTEKTKTTI